MFYTTFNSAPIIGHIAEISGSRARRYPLIISETFNFFASAIEQPVTGKCEIPAGCGHLTFNPSKRSRHRCGPVDFNEKGKIVLASRQKESLRKKKENPDSLSAASHRNPNAFHYSLFVSHFKQMNTGSGSLETRTSRLAEML